MYYFLANRPNPTRYPLIFPGALDEGDVVRTLEQAPVRYALISDIAFESFPFQYVAPTVWDYLDRHFKPADDAGWSVAPHAPYLYSRGTRADLAQMDLLTAAGEASAVAVTPIVSVNTDYADWEEARALMQPPLSPTPVFQTVAVDDWRSRDPRVVAWQSTHLDPSLVVRAPGGWRKVLVSWEVPSEPGFSFEFACALTPWAWAGWTKGQGALVEVWVSASPETGETGEMEETAPPRRVWWQWLNPRDVPADRRWHRAAVDLASFVATRRAIVTLVVGSAPTFKAADATVAWSSLRLIVPKDTLPSIADSQHVEPRNIRLGVGTARRMLGFEKDDLRVFEEATSRYPELASAHAALAEVAVSLGDYRTALLASQNAVRVDPEQHHYWMRLGQELQRAGRVAEALEAMGIAIDQAPTNPNYHAALAAALVTLPKGLEKARAASLTAIRLDPANTWAWTLLSSVERQAGAPEAAVQAADRSVMLEPNEAWPHLILAESLQAMGRTHEALQALERAASLNMDAGARTALARNLLNCGSLNGLETKRLPRQSKIRDPRGVGPYWPR